ncbi:Cilia- and flagella-associated protein 91 [Coelomomyces lativittatus]|nr:Cilia- and flagella-associated protein 91 [Coelomomyces lativittatus]KAJ1509559.1 Cilia- and flagella-associated protein 91 [Coelomomyces lativittatus]KAJ1510851.1 Cilia- and flagella-associated protein 91 [Coelomomyces lativittatus]
MAYIRPCRPNDYLYDPVYTVSCYKDHIQTLAAARTTRVAVVPNFRNMFSNLPNYPSVFIELRKNFEKADLGNDRYVPVDEHPHVNGKNRYKYFRKPLIPYIEPVQHLVPKPKLPESNPETHANESMFFPPKKVNMAVQTMYRENDAQTDPYSPEYTFSSGQRYPEILALASLTYQAGLPVGLAEIEMIERARLKKIWEQSLPVATDEVSFQKRLKMMEAMELKEWAEREKEIQRLQKRKLAILAHLLIERSKKSENLTQLRIQKMWQAKMMEKKVLKEKMEWKKAKYLRKLIAKRKQMECQKTKRDIIAEFSHPSREIPNLRDGIPTHLKSLENPNLQYSVSVINEIEKQSLLSKELKVSITVPSLKEESTPSSRKEALILAQLEKMDLKLKEAKVKEPKKSDNKTESPPLRFLVPLPKPVKRAPTPTLPCEDPKEKIKNATALCIQRYLRGRSVQIEMEMDKEKKQDLIDELRLSMTLNDANVQFESDLTSPSTSPIEKSDDEEPSEDVLKFVQAEFVGQYLDYLHKEITRLQDEKRLAAMVKLAERTRKMREAQESGQRQAELERREREDAIFKQRMQLNQETVDTYLEEILMDGVESSSRLAAREKVQTMTEKINEVVGSSINPAPDHSLQSTLLSSSKSNSSSAFKEDMASLALVTDLVESFLIPETEKRILKQQVEFEQQKYILAAHQVIYDTVPQIEEKMNFKDQPVPLPENVLKELTSDLNEKKE